LNFGLHVTDDKIGKVRYGFQGLTNPSAAAAAPVSSSRAFEQSDGTLPSGGKPSAAAATCTMMMMLLVATRQSSSRSLLVTVIAAVTGSLLLQCGPVTAECQLSGWCVATDEYSRDCNTLWFFCLFLTGRLQQERMELLFTCTWVSKVGHHAAGLV